MHTLSLLNGLSIWDKIGCILDLIPKLVYFLYTCMASAVDVMQMLARRICGLDVYYVDGVAIYGQDPITEFINGILGFGDSKGAYQALNTTFWSLAIFALILLALSSFVAIIKAHYNEDTSKTSPSKILYNAFKAIVTFAIVPFAVIFGIQLSSLLLRTLDNITNVPATEEALTGIYGANAVNNFFTPVTTREDEDSTSNQKIYGSYDMFGLGAPSNNAPISGMLFRAAAYNSNRFRNGEYDYKTEMLFEMKSGENLFGNPNSAGYNSAEDKQEYVAYQVDYAFMNNLHFVNGYSYVEFCDYAVNSGGPVTWEALDIFANLSFHSFTKYNVSFVWMYYNLWQFNFIVAFAGVASTFGIMISIILGLMIRLIKSAAMFLIYPPLLGLSPIDDFKAFKSWSNDFIKQILSTYGAVIGLNLLFLILPYVQQIEFFTWGLLNAIVNVVFLIAGLVMAKDFISMVAGFVGGGDVFSSGEGAKGNVSKSLTKGLKMATGVGVVPAKALKAGASLAYRGISRKVASGQLEKRNQALNSYYKEKEKYENENIEEAAKTGTGWLAHNVKYNKASKDTYDKYLKDIGKDESTATLEEKKKAYKEAEKVLYNEDESYRNSKNTIIADRSGVSKFRTKKEKDSGAILTDEELQKRMEAKATKNYLNVDGTASEKGLNALLSNTTAAFRGSIKNLFSKDMLSNIGLDKMTATVKDMTGIFMSKDANDNPLVKQKEYKPNTIDDYGKQREKIKEEAIKSGVSEDKMEEHISKKLHEMLDTKDEKSKIKDAIVAALKEVGNGIFTGVNRSSPTEKIADDKLPRKQYEKTVETNKKLDSMSDAIKDLVSFLKSKP